MKKWRVFFLSMAILSAAVGIAVWFYISRRPTERKPPKEISMLVEVLPVKAGPHAVKVVGMGTVIPARQVTLKPEVSGRIIGYHPNLVPGGFLQVGEEIVRVDPRDYKYAVEARKADLERARFELELEKGRQNVAHREWEILQTDIKNLATDRDLALRVPHLRNAQAALKAAESGLQNAELELERTRIQAPFNCKVLDESVEFGQYVTPQTILATLVGTDQFWVKVAVPVSHLQWLHRPSSRGTGGATATVIQEQTGSTSIARRGQVIRILGDLDPVGRLARLLVSIDDPFGLESDEEKRDLQLFLGAYVRVEIEGQEIERAYELPRSAIREGDRVWVANGEDRLEIRPVQIAWRGAKLALIRDGLEDGERVVTSPIPIPIEGMRLRFQKQTRERSS
jgi:RND family efflux transporter MFP subunit